MIILLIPKKIKFYNINYIYFLKYINYLFSKIIFLLYVFNIHFSISFIQINLALLLFK